MAALQEGIYYRRGQRPGRFFAILFLRAAPESDAQKVGTCFAELWAMYQELKEGRIRDLDGVVLPHDHDQLSVLAGLGRNAFKLDGIGLEKPEGLGDQHLFRSPLPDGGGPLLIGSGLSYALDARANLATEELCVQAIADTKLAVDRVIVETWKLLSDRVDPATGAAPLQLTTFYLGAQRSDHRSWIDFHDGLSNMRSEDREQAIAIEAGTDVDWAVGGTYLAFLRLAVDLPLWRTLDRTSQELVVGRDKLTGCPLTGVEGETHKSDPGCPVGGTQIWEEANDESFSEPPSADDARIRQSHVQRANHHQEPPSDAGTRRIFRQGYEFLEWKDSSPGFRPGLNFVSFQDTPQRLLRMLTAEGWLGQVNFGGDPDDEPKSLLTTYAAAIYFVPPLRDSELFPGARALGLTDIAGAPGSDQ